LCVSKYGGVVVVVTVRQLDLHYITEILLKVALNTTTISYIVAVSFIGG
jgi:hypothetical protein